VDCAIRPEVKTRSGKAQRARWGKLVKLNEKGWALMLKFPLENNKAFSEEMLW
jgi:hypothetical protein